MFHNLNLKFLFQFQLISEKQGRISFTIDTFLVRTIKVVKTQQFQLFET